MWSRDKSKDSVLRWEVGGASRQGHTQGVCGPRAGTVDPTWSRRIIWDGGVAYAARRRGEWAEHWAEKTEAGPMIKGRGRNLIWRVGRARKRKDRQCYRWDLEEARSVAAAQGDFRSPVHPPAF